MKYIVGISIAFLLSLLIVYYNFYHRLEVGEPELLVKGSPLIAEISFATDDSIKVQIKYWLAGKPELSDTTLDDDVSQQHRIKLVGLKGDVDYEYQVICVDGRSSKVFEFSTPKTKKPPMLKALWTEPLKDSFTGYILSQRAINIGRNAVANGYIYLTDSVGEAVWYQKIAGLPKVSLVTPNNTFLVISGNPQQERSAGDHLFEYDIYGNQLLALSLSSLKESFEIHHDVRCLPDGSLLALIYDKRRVEGLKFSTDKNIEEVKGDAIVKIDRKGNIVWKWSVFDVENPKASSFAVDSLGVWGHANTLAVDQDGNYLISFRDWNQIWKIDSSTGKVIWKLGEGGDFELPKDLSFSGQHSIHVNHKQEYMMFDNGVKNGISRVVSFKLDEKKKEILNQRIITLPEILFSPKRGSAYYIDDKRILVCAPETNSLAIIDEKGTILGRAHTGLPDYYRATYIPSLY